MTGQGDEHTGTQDSTTGAASQPSSPGWAGASRRGFLKASASVVAGSAAVGLLSGAAAAQETGPVQDELRGLREQPRLLLKGGLVLSLDPHVGDFAQADVLIERGKIAEVRPSIPAGPDTAVFDAANTIVLPGFIDTHHHSYQALCRGVLANGLLDPDYRRDIVGYLTPAYQASDAYAGVLISALGALDQGITTVLDTSQVSHTPEHSDACIQAFRDAGIRTVFAYARGDGPAQQYPDDIRRLLRTYFSSRDQLLTPGLGLSLTDAALDDLLAIAREVDVLVAAHGTNNTTDQRIQALGHEGRLGPFMEYIHCTQLSDAAWQTIRETGGGVSLSVTIEMTMNHGMPGIADAVANGVRPSLSSDVDVTMTQDPFTIMRSAFTLQRLLTLQRQRAGEQDLPPLLTCRDVLEFATIEGARCTHLDDKVGTLTPGKDADIVVLRTDRLSVWPINNAAGAVVNLMDTSNVDTVFVAGQVKKHRGTLVGVDVPHVLQLVEQARTGVISRSGFPLNLLG
jgi:5-methylthioadenosine/S-adenosylhomocysteine deaminase